MAGGAWGGRGHPLSRDLRTDLGPDAKLGYEGTDRDQVFRTAVRSGVLCPIRVCEVREVAAGSKLLPQRGVPSFKVHPLGYTCPRCLPPSPVGPDLRERWFHGACFAMAAMSLLSLLLEKD